MGQFFSSIINITKNPYALTTCMCCNVFFSTYACSTLCLLVLFTEGYLLSEETPMICASSTYM